MFIGDYVIIPAKTTATFCLPIWVEVIADKTRDNKSKSSIDFCCPVLTSHLSGYERLSGSKGGDLLYIKSEDTQDIIDLFIPGIHP